MSLIEQIGSLATRIATEFKNIRDILNLPDTTFANQVGVIEKNGIPFLHNFSYGNNGSVTPSGRNIFIGKNAGNFSMGATATSIDHGSYLIGIGDEALSSAVTANWCVAIGYQALKNKTIGGGCYAIGYQSQLANVSGIYNVSLGTWTLFSNVSGGSNVAIGYRGLYNNTDSNNTAIGTRSLYGKIAGGDNLAGGYYSGYNLTSGAQNVLLGSNSALLTAAGGNLASINNSVLIGYGSRADASGQTNQIVIGHSAVGNGSNTVQIGNTSITNVYTSGKIGHADATLVTESATLGQVTLQQATTGGNSTTNQIIGTTLKIGETFEVPESKKYTNYIIDKTSNLPLFTYIREAYSIDDEAWEIDHSFAVGIGAMANASSAYLSSNAHGYNTLKNSTNAYCNAFGNFALQENSGIDCNAFGFAAMLANAGHQHVAFGNYALSYTASSSLRLTAIGHNAANSGTPLNFVNSTAIGADSTIVASNEISLGSDNVTSVRTTGIITHAPATTDAHSATLGQVKTEINTKAPKVISGKTLTSGSWSLVSGLYEYDLSDANIAANSIVDIIPDNASMTVVMASLIQPRTDSSTGSVKVYALENPTDTITVTIIITEKTV